MIWTAQSEVALEHARFDKRVMPAANQKFLDILNQLIDVTTQELTRIERTKFETLVTIHVHQKDIFDDLVRSLRLCVLVIFCDCTLILVDIFPTRRSSVANLEHPP